jgi:hypothetical protein
MRTHQGPLQRSMGTIMGMWRFVEVGVIPGGAFRAGVVVCCFPPYGPSGPFRFLPHGRSARKTDDAGLVDEIRLTVTDLPSYGYSRVWVGHLAPSAGEPRHHSRERQTRVSGHARSRLAATTQARSTTAAASARWQGRSGETQPALVFRRLRVSLRERRAAARDLCAGLL